MSCNDIITRLREMAESPVYSLRRGVLLVAARNLEQLESENERLKGTCSCMDCGKTIKTIEQSKHNKECKNE